MEANKKRKSYTVAEKLAAITLAKRTSKKKAAREFKVDVKRIREWCKQEVALSAVTKTTKAMRLSGGGRPFKHELLDEKLVKWIQERRSNNLRVSRKMIQKKAKTIFDETEGKSCDSFSASEGWLSKFLERNNFSLRRRTTIAQKLPEDVEEKVVSFLIYVEGLRRNCCYQERSIGAADETAIWVDALQDTTVTETGAKSVPICSTGNHKAKYDAMDTGSLGTFLFWASSPRMGLLSLPQDRHRKEKSKQIEHRHCHNSRRLHRLVAAPRCELEQSFQGSLFSTLRRLDDAVRLRNTKSNRSRKPATTNKIIDVPMGCTLVE